MRILISLSLLLTPLGALAEDRAAPPPPVRLYGHLAYGEADRTALAAPVSLPGCQLVREAAEDLDRLVAAARADGIELGAVSCFRSIQHQRRVFCGGAEDCDAVAALRSRFVGPPGHSEHATGYAVDFVQRGQPCPAVEQCFATTPAGQWLMRRAAAFGFELSFPAGNKQGVAWEPWHWRWVGRPEDARPATTLARQRFAAAQAHFPALPAVSRARPQLAQTVRAGRTSVAYPRLRNVFVAP